VCVCDYKYILVTDILAETFYLNITGRGLNELVTLYVGTDFYNTSFMEMIEGMRRRGRRRKQLLDGLKGRIENCKLKKEAIDRSVWRTRFGRGCRTL
jgi:hypothetical protein